MPYYLGIDAGGSHTRAALCDSAGHIVCRGVGGPANYLHTDRTTLIDSLTAALHSALPSQTCEIAAICIGMAGLGRRAERDAARSLLCQIAPLFEHAEVTHDARIAWAGGTALSPGIVLISGTGSIAYGVDTEGNEHRAGGYGPLYADEGSGFAMGRLALSYCLRAADGRSGSSLLVELVCRQLGIYDPKTLAIQVAENRISRQEVSRLPQAIAVASGQGDRNAQAIIMQSADDLVDLIVAVAGQGQFSVNGTTQVALCGGTLSKVPELAEMVVAHTCHRLPRARVVDGATSPLGWALLMALAAQGIAASPHIVSNLRASGEGGGIL